MVFTLKKKTKQIQTPTKSPLHCHQIETLRVQACKERESSYPSSLDRVTLLSNPEHFIRGALSLPASVPSLALCPQSSTVILKHPGSLEKNFIRLFP